MKKFFKGMIGLTILIMVALWSPWISWDIEWYELLGIESPEPISALQVTALSGGYTIYIDDQVFEMEEDSSPFFIADITPGEHLVRLERQSEVSGAYANFSRLINFPENGEVVLFLNMGPEEVFSEWHIIIPKQKDTNTELTTIEFDTNTADPNLLVGSLPVAVIDGEGFSEVTLDSQKTVIISKDGYESQEFVLFPESQEDRDSLEKFDFEIYIHLMLQPVSVN